MSDSSTTALDRKRPWLTDERELPANMNWLQTLFNPTGTSPRLHFTRAWTLLFMLQLLVIILPWSIALIFNSAGGDGQPIGEFGLFATPVVFIVTTLISYVIHSRRLLDAGKTPLLAIIPLIPLIIGLAVFMMTAQAQSAQYDKRFEMRQDYLADPDGFRAKQREEREKAKAEAEKKAAEAEANGEAAPSQPQGQGRRGPGGPGGMMNFEQPLPPKAEFVLKNALPPMQMIMILLSAPIAIWSLMWVARAPLYLPKFVYENDSYRFAFLTWHGRLSRKRFALSNLLLSLAQIGVLAVFGIAAAISKNMAVMLVPAAISTLIGLYFSSALLVKRVHDLGYDMLGVLKIVAPITVALFVVVAVVSVATGGNMPGWFLLLVAIPAIIGGVAGFVALLWLWFGEPEWRDNKHGKAPEVIPVEAPLAVS